MEEFNIINALWLGLLQGLSEFLPISSSGHLVLTPWLFGWEDPGLTFDVALHFGTLLAVVAYFWQDWIEIFRSALLQGRKRAKTSQANNAPLLLWFIFFATVPGVLVGYFLNDLAETALRHPLLIAFNLFFFGLLLFLADVRFEKKRAVSQINLCDAILIGLAQAVAILPGVSRSGITITAGLSLGLDRQSAARFSFLLATPVILGATVYKLPEFLSVSVGSAEIIGILAATIAGYLAIAGLIKFVEKISYQVFFWYRLLLALIIIVFWIKL